MAQHGSLEEFLAVAVDAAKRAGEIIHKGFYETKHVVHKGQALAFYATFLQLYDSINCCMASETAP